VVVGGVGLVVIAIGQGVPNRHSVEGQLERRTAQALQAAGITDAEVDFVGRDGTVRVKSAADGDRALAIVRGQTGVESLGSRCQPRRLLRYR
jgi:hypothetical protein